MKEIREPRYTVSFRCIFDSDRAHMQPALAYISASLGYVFGCIRLGLLWLFWFITEYPINFVSLVVCIISLIMSIAVLVHAG